MRLENRSALYMGLSFISRSRERSSLARQDRLKHSKMLADRGARMLSTTGSEATLSTNMGIQRCFTSPTKLVLFGAPGAGFGEQRPIWLRKTHKDAKSFQIVSERDGEEIILYRIRGNRIKNGSKKLINTADGLKNVENLLDALAFAR